jgi:hypothetical protein
MTKTEYDEISRRSMQLMADASLLAELMRNARCSIHADKVLSICTDAGNVHDKWQRIEPNWNAPDSSDCHTHS